MVEKAAVSEGSTAEAQRRAAACGKALDLHLTRLRCGGMTGGRRMFPCVEITLAALVEQAGSCPSGAHRCHAPTPPRREKPGAYGQLGLADLFELREECLREFGFQDVYRCVCVCVWGGGGGGWGGGGRVCERVGTEGPRPAPAASAAAAQACILTAPFSLPPSPLPILPTHPVCSKDKERENQAALEVLPDLLAELDRLAPPARLLALVQGVLAANIFDWGAKACVDLYQSATILEMYREVGSRGWCVGTWVAVEMRVHVHV